MKPWLIMVLIHYYALFKLNYHELPWYNGITMVHHGSHGNYKQFYTINNHSSSWFPHGSQWFGDSHGSHDPARVRSVRGSPRCQPGPEIPKRRRNESWQPTGDSARWSCDARPTCCAQDVLSWKLGTRKLVHDMYWLMLVTRSQWPMLCLLPVKLWLIMVNNLAQDGKWLFAIIVDGEGY